LPLRRAIRSFAARQLPQQHSAPPPFTIPRHYSHVDVRMYWRVPDAWDDGGLHRVYHRTCLPNILAVHGFIPDDHRGCDA